MKLDTIAIHVPRSRREGSIAPPINLSTTFEHGPANEPLFAHEYVRDGNPNVDDLEARLASLEGAAGSVAFASGMAAGSALLQTLPAGSRVLFHKDLYFDFGALATTLLPQWGIVAERADLTDADALHRALERKPSLIWFETPSNPMIDVIDIEAISAAARLIGAKVIVDSTFAPPFVQRPIDLGANFVLHSLTKYMGGHSDVQGGSISVAADDGLVDQLLRIRRITGGVLSPFNAWLVSRGLQSLGCRIERHCANALAVAKALETRPEIARVRYPMLESHPGYSIARRQMNAGGGMVSIEVNGGRDAAIAVASKVNLFTNATSLGGVESLIEHRASVEGSATSTPQSLLRLSIGLEAADDLIDDIIKALAK